MKIYWFFLLIWVLPLYSSAQLHPEAIPVRILDASLISANYRWRLDPRARETLERTFGEAQWAAIADKTQETHWPPGFRSREDREENRHWFCDLNAYFLQRFSVDKALVWIPAAENQRLPPQLQQTEDWYLVIRESALEQVKGISKYPQTLEAQLDFLLKDYLEGYTQSRQEEDPLAPATLEGRELAARFMLEGARSATFLRSLEGNRLTYIANFPPTAMRADALRQYQDLLQRISAARLSACPLSRSRERSQANGMLQTSFTAFDYAGDMNPRYRGLTLEVRLVQTFAQSGVNPVWFAQLAILP